MKLFRFHKTIPITMTAPAGTYQAHIPTIQSIQEPRINIHSESSNLEPELIKPSEEPKQSEVICIK